MIDYIETDLDVMIMCLLLMSRDKEMAQSDDVSVQSEDDACDYWTL